MLRALGKAPIALGKEQSAKNPSVKVSLPSATYRALGKAFAECHVSTRQKKSDVNSDGLFAECHLSGTRQRIFFFENSLPSAILLHSAKKFFLFLKKNLCRVPWLWHSAKLGNWVSASQLCRVPWSRHSAKPSLPSVALGKEGKNAIFWFFAFHQHKQRNHIYINTQHRIYHIHIHIPSHTHP